MGSPVEGLIVAGMNQPVYWGLYLTNYVFFIGISHAGTLISAILRLTDAEWRRPITRAAEAITVFALLMGTSNVLWHLGRPELIYIPMLHPQPLSPLIWDVACISVYLMGSITYLYLPLIPDLALLRDRSPRLRWLYRWLSLGWQGTPKQHKLLERAIGFMAVAIIPIAVSVHTVVSWVFAICGIVRSLDRILWSAPSSVVSQRYSLQWPFCARRFISSHFLDLFISTT